MNTLTTAYIICILLAVYIMPPHLWLMLSPQWLKIRFHLFLLRRNLKNLEKRLVQWKVIHNRHLIQLPLKQLRKNKNWKGNIHNAIGRQLAIIEILDHHKLFDDIEPPLNFSSLEQEKKELDTYIGNYTALRGGKDEN